jgi:hypothetical protein
VAALDTGAAPGESGEPAADAARRAAIAAMGPIKKREGTNAADYYKEALGLYAGLTDAEKKMLANWRVKGDPKAEAALYAKIQAIMDLLRKGRAANYADWGVGPFSLYDPSAIQAESAVMNSIRNLAVMAGWEANYRFGSDPGGALGDLAAMDALGRSGDDRLIGFLVENSVHALAVGVLAANVGEIPADGGADLSYLIDPAAVYQDYQAGMDGEATGFQVIMDEYNNPATRANVVSSFNQYIHSANPNSSPANMSPGQFASEMQWIEQTEEALGGTLQEPDAQFQQWWAQKEAEAASTPIEASVLAAIAPSRSRAQTVLVQNLIVQAGLALEQGGQAGFQAITDPTTGQPFTYTQTATGFTLTSGFKASNGKPVTLSFGPPAGQ